MRSCCSEVQFVGVVKVDWLKLNRGALLPHDSAATSSEYKVVSLFQDIASNGCSRARFVKPTSVAKSNKRWTFVTRPEIGFERSVAVYQAVRVGRPPFASVRSQTYLYCKVTEF